MKANPETILSLAARTATKIGSFDPEQDEVQEIIRKQDHRYWRVLEDVFIKPIKPVQAPESRPCIEILRETPKPCDKRTADEQVAGLGVMYEMLGWHLSTAGLMVPERRKGFDRLLVVDDMMTNNLGFEACEASFPSRRYVNDLDIAIPTNERHPSKNGIYVVWFRDRVEADEELKDKSADDIVMMGLRTITLLERELFELVHFMETGKHLDIQNWTLCSGSRNSDGNVPNAGWCDGEFEVRRLSHDDQGLYLRSREAVTLAP